MDMLDEALEASHDKTNDSTGSDDVQLSGQGESPDSQAMASVQQGATLSLDPNIQYQFRTETGQVTYRVVQVAQDGTEAAAQVVTTNAFPQATQAVIQSPFSNGGSPTPDNQADTRYTYFPTGATDQTAAAQQSEVASASLGQVATAGGTWANDAALGQGQFYVMMSPQDVLQGQRNIAPRTGFNTPKIDGGRSGRDDRRRATHNEVERRRRDKINNWIVTLSKLVPDCAQEHVKQGQTKVSENSKGGILSKACDYINELRNGNVRMAESLKETERLSVDLELLRQQCEDMKNENAILRAQLQSHGIIPDVSGGS
ncbi:upstream stimulatory factor 2-like [Mizuhopecten yessoensis]|uniref:Upstream stimulatory factor 2 n=1 Tax=Mizuhopecten yessoensis TaxID=6573 RepID=A0A210QW62_MIZYE|nr:upstream stimulatory factor 2-like [Mizuhopecten yessoensis]OWF52944.1 Upstream stimulatory factor 2 [Mizuhopecten yessoensis]